jgi:hypothetical protein
MKSYSTITLFLINLLIINYPLFSQEISPIVHDKNLKTVILSDSTGNLRLRVNYSNGCVLDQIIVNGKEVTGKGNFVYSGIRLGDSLISSKLCFSRPVLTIHNNSIIINDIKFGNNEFDVKEEWIFKVCTDEIQWTINRHYLTGGIISENCFPCWQFNSMQTWDGALLDNGGVAWNRFLNEPGDRYGSNTSMITLWNRSANSCLRIIPDDIHNTFRTATFGHQENNTFSVVQSSSVKEIKTNSGLRRFIKSGEPVFAPFNITRSDISCNYTLQARLYDQEYDRGVFHGINEGSVNEILNTIGRYGVVDKNLYGSNGWRTGWVVLQEPWFALFGLAINSSDFINGFAEALEYEKEHAIMTDGRVLPRWHHDPTDAMPGTFREDGFYECLWGYMFDSQPAFAINVAEQFDLNGDIDWLRRFKPVCEKVLDYLIKRDSDGNGLFEVVQKTHNEQKGTDWLDVVWASYEVATINAYMYNALVRWSDLEDLLGDKRMSEYYQSLALKLKTTYNKNISDGGFWDPDNRWYVHWREKDGSVYGNNLGSVINFLAIGYGICDDPARKEIILTRMEELMQKEKLFIWPSCFFPYEENVGLKNVNYPFPNYENGDLFLAWAELGTRCYAEKNPEIALKYIRNVIDRYESDGLAHQRYTRIKQTGAGDDILSNNIMAVVGLYRNIFGIRPQYNRLYLEPHLTTELNGTQLKYRLRNQDYLIELSKDKYTIGINDCNVSNNKPFAVNYSNNELEYFNGNDNHFSLKVSVNQPLSINIINWGKNNMSWTETGKSHGNTIHYELNNLSINGEYQLFINDKPVKKYYAGDGGMISFDWLRDGEVLKIDVTGKK